MVASHFLRKGIKVKNGLFHLIIAFISFEILIFSAKPIEYPPSKDKKYIILNTDHIGLAKKTECFTSYSFMSLIEPHLANSIDFLSELLLIISVCSTLRCLY